MPGIFESVAAALGVKQGSVMAAFFGALVSLPFIKAPAEYDGWKVGAYKLYIVVAGMLCAIFIGPPVANYGEFMAMEGAIVFFIGVTGMAVAAAFHRAIEQVDFLTLTSAVGDWIKRATSGKGK